MDIASLHAFVTIADHGSFSSAANRLHVTQPAVSKRIATLEEELNVRLFDRLGRTVRLTEAGTLLLRGRGGFWPKWMTAAGRCAISLASSPAP